jgi:hypothetical protein
MVTSRKGHQSMQDIRKVLCWCFGATSLMYLLTPFWIVLYAIRRHYGFPTLHNLLTTVSFAAAVAFISGVAWWTILKEIPSGRGWGIAASLMEILIFLRPIIFSLRTAWPHHAGALFVGIVGLIAFSRLYTRHDSATKPCEPGDSGLGGPRL